MVATTSQKRHRARWWAGGKYVLALFVVVASLMLGAPPVGAEPTGGFTVSPAQLVFTLNADTPQQSTELNITNNYSTDLHLVAELDDIDQASVNLLPSGPLKDASLAAAVSLSATDITVPAYGVYKLKVQVTDNGALLAGGHYASLVLTQQVPLTEAQAYRSALAVSMFVVKANGVKTDLQLLGVETNRWLFGLPSEARLLFRNAGNVHVIPRASVSLYATGDSLKLLGQGVINTESRVLFPGQEKTYLAPIARLERLWVPQKVQMIVSYRIQGNDVQLESKQTFWYIPAVYLLLPLIPLVAIGLLLAYKYRAAIGRAGRRFGRTIHARTKRLIHQATPVTKSVASTIRLALKRAYLAFLEFARERRTAYVAWRIRRAEEQAAIQAAKDAVRGKPIDLWANEEFTEPAHGEDGADRLIASEGEPIGRVSPLEDAQLPLSPSVVVAPDMYTPEALPIDPPKPSDPLIEPLLDSDEFAVLQQGTDSAQPSVSSSEPDVPETAEGVPIVPIVGKPPRSKAKAAAKRLPEPPVEPKPVAEPAKPPELPKYKPVDYPGLRKLGLAPSNAPKPIPAKRPAATTPGVSRVPQLVKSTKTTLPKPTRKRASGATKSAAQAAKKSSAKTAKTSAVKKPKNASPRTKSSGRTQS